jgi:hypothetical protein
MSTRLQIVVSEDELEAIREAALSCGLTVSAWARAALQDARRAVAHGDADRKLAAIRAAHRYAYPTADIDRILAEIEQGYGEVTES